MKRALFSLAFASFLGCALDYANNVDFKVGININPSRMALV